MVFASNLEGHLTVLQFTETNISVDMDEPTQIPYQIILHQNYPNPFNPRTTIDFSIPQTDFVTFKIYNLEGLEITTLIKDKLSVGNHSIQWKATNNLGQPVSAGIYLYQIQAGEYISTKKMVLLK